MTTAPAKPGRRIDLDQARAARAAQRQEGNPVVVLDGVEYELPVELPLSVVEGMVAVMSGLGGDLRATLAGLFGPGADAVLAAMSTDDLREVFAQTGDLYGLDMGNAQASTSSSSATSAP